MISFVRSAVQSLEERLMRGFEPGDDRLCSGVPFPRALPNNTLHATGIAAVSLPVDRSAFPSLGSPVRELHRWAVSEPLGLRSWR